MQGPSHAYPTGHEITMHGLSVP